MLSLVCFRSLDLSKGSSSSFSPYPSWSSTFPSDLLVNKKEGGRIEVGLNMTLGEPVYRRQLSSSMEKRTSSDKTTTCRQKLFCVEDREERTFVFTR